MKEHANMLHFYFDNNLHEVPENEQDMRKAADYYAAKCIQEENHITAGLLANYYRILHEYLLAEYWIKIAIDLAQKNSSDKSIYINKLRWAHILIWMKDFKKSKEFLDEVNTQIQENKKYHILKASYHQHMGKWYFDQGEFQNALKHFKITLDIRILGGIKDLIVSSAFAVKITEQKIVILN